MLELILNFNGKKSLIEIPFSIQDWTPDLKWIFAYELFQSIGIMDIALDPPKGKIILKLKDAKKQAWTTINTLTIPLDEKIWNALIDELIIKFNTAK